MWRIPRSAALLLAAAVLAPACSSRVLVFDPDEPTTGADPTTSAAPGTTAPQAGDTTSMPVPTAAPGYGETGRGDPYFPLLGNGGYDVTHYLIDLEVDPDAGVLAGTTTIEATALTTLAGFNLDLRGLEISGLSVDGAPAAFTRDDSEIVVTPAVALAGGESFSVAVDYAGTPEPAFLGTTGIAAGWIKVPSGVYVVAEPDGARTWFPGSDHPSDKAAFTYRITVPDAWNVAAAGRFVSATPGGAGFTTHVWEMKDPMATYLATIVVADLVRIDRGTVDGVVLRDYLPPDLADDPPAAFARIEEMLGFLIERFGPYPFDAYGHAVVDRFPGALENQTLSLFGRDALAPFIAERVTVHELAHMWFGDSVTPATWQDIWLNEGLATFAEFLWVEHTLGTAAMEDQIAGEHATLGLIPHRPPGDPGIDELFGISVYQRGGLTLHALRREIGDDALFGALQEYAARYAYGNATTADFIAVVEEVSDRDLGDFFSAWLYEPEVPPLPEG